MGTAPLSKAAHANAAPSKKLRPQLLRQSPPSTSFHALIHAAATALLSLTWDGSSNEDEAGQASHDAEGKWRGCGLICKLKAVVDLPATGVPHPCHEAGGQEEIHGHKAAQQLALLPGAAQVSASLEEGGLECTSHHVGAG